MFEKIGKRVRELWNLPEQLRATYNGIQRVNGWLDTFEERTRPRAPRPFAAMLVYGETPRLAWQPSAVDDALPLHPVPVLVPVFCGDARELDGDDATLEAQFMRPVSNATILVFCDLSQVQLGGIFVGTDLIQGTLGSCPIAKVSRTIEPGVWVRVRVVRRTR